VISQRLEPDPGNLAVRDFRGASRNVRHGEIVNPSAIERAGTETPHLQRGARSISIPTSKCRSRAVASILWRAGAFALVGAGAALTRPYWRGFVGPAGVLERGRGTGWVARKPLRWPTHVHVRLSRQWDRRLNKEPGPTRDLRPPGSAGDGEHKEGGLAWAPEANQISDR
jgi:hypothetical protein